AEALRPRRARDHRREQLVRRAGDDGVRRARGLLGRRGRVDRRLLRRQRPRPRARREPRMIDGIELIPLELHGDERGWVYELRRDSALARPLPRQRPRPRARREPRMIDGIELIPLELHGDERGWVYELRRDSALPA